jgi:hypothetical protein
MQLKISEAPFESGQLGIYERATPISADDVRIVPASIACLGAGREPRPPARRDERARSSSQPATQARIVQRTLVICVRRNGA